MVTCLLWVTFLHLCHKFYQPKEKALLLCSQISYEEKAETKNSITVTTNMDCFFYIKISKDKLVMSFT